MEASVFGIASSSAQGEQAMARLRAAGFSDDDVSVLLADRSGTRDLGHESNTKAPEGATVGAGTGGAIGGALGWLVGAGALAIPGIGPFIAAGPILAALSGVAMGAAAGGLSGALIGAGIPEYEARRYEGKLREGNVLISVHVDDREERQTAKQILEECGLEGIGTAGEKDPESARGRDTSGPKRSV